MCRLRNFSAILFCMVPVMAWCLPEDTTQPMQITADSTSFDYARGTGIYEGHVTVTQGKTRLNADRLMTFNNARHKIEKAVAYGTTKPARYMTYLSLTDNRQLQAEAAIINFYPFRSLVILTGNARVTHGEDQFQGPVAVYDMKNQTVNAPQSPNGRAKILIQPDQATS